jgi:uncharacterized protein YbaP (TraB family)
MRRTPVAALFSLFLATLAPTEAEAQTASPPACKGRDLFGQLKTSDPAAFAEVRAAADATVNARAVLWRIEGQGQPASFLFGTVHSTDERVRKLSPAIQSALGGARKVALELAELAPGEAAQAIMNIKDVAGQVTYANGNGLADRLSESELKKLRTILGKRGISPGAVHLLRPWFAWFAFVMPECEKRRSAAGLAFLDQRIAQEAKKRGQPVVGLETIRGQIDALAGLSEEAQLGLLKTSLAFLDRQEDLLEVLVQLYLARDIGAIMPFSAKIAEKGGFDPAVYAPFERDIVEKRNLAMRDAVLPLLKEGGVFIAVGALHLPGKGGLVELFREAGYAVTAVE